MFECANCLSRSVYVISNFSYEECGYEGEGTVTFYECSNCGAEIEYCVPAKLDSDEVADEK